MKIEDLSITGEQCLAARVLLGISEDELANAASLHRRTVAAFENGVRHPCVYALRMAFERLGAEFNADGSVRRHNGEPGEYRPEWSEALREWQIRVGVRARQALGDFSGKATWGPAAVGDFEEYPVTP